MTPTAPEPASQQTTDLLQFDGFPYLNTRLLPALYHITLLPVNASESTLLMFARVQAAANRLDTCLVLDPARATYFWADGRITSSASTPRGGTVLANRLVLPVDLLETNELRHRQACLDHLVAEGRRRGTYVNALRIGRAASDEEAARLGGKNVDGSPAGLTRCGQCLEWRGECLQGAETSAAIVPVHCRCENHNRCARCAAPLYERRLNASFYDPLSGETKYVPGFCGLGHACNAPARLTLV